MTNDACRQRAAALQLHGLLAHWAECAKQPWLDPLLSWEESERARRSLERRLRCAHIGRFKPLADLDWAWPQQCDQRAVAELMTLDFLPATTNRDRRKPHGLPLPHHRTYGSRIRRFDELNSYRGARLGSPRFSKKRNGSAMDRAGVLDSRHGPW
jgi:hypothetical protein